MVKSLSWLFESLKMNVAAEPMAGESNPIPAGNGIRGAQMEKYNRELLRAGILAWVNIIWRLSLEGRGRREVQVGQQEEFPHGKGGSGRIWRILLPCPLPLLSPCMLCFLTDSPALPGRGTGKVDVVLIQPGNLSHLNLHQN